MMVLLLKIPLGGRVLSVPGMHTVGKEDVEFVNLNGIDLVLKHYCLVCYCLKAF